MAGAAAVDRPVIPRLINRLRPANHYPERRWLTGVLGRHPERPEVLRRAREYQILEALTGLERATLVGLTLHRFAPWYGVDRRLGRPLPAAVAYLSAPLWPDIGGGREHAGGGGGVPGVLERTGGDLGTVVVAPGDGVPVAPDPVVAAVCRV